MEETLYDIIDREGSIMPRHFSGRARTKKEADKMLERLNKDGEYKPYSLLKVDEQMGGSIYMSRKRNDLEITLGDFVV